MNAFNTQINTFIIWQGYSRSAKSLLGKYIYFWKVLVEINSTVYIIAAPIEIKGQNEVPKVFKRRTNTTYFGRSKWFHPLNLYIPALSTTSWVHRYPTWLSYVTFDSVNIYIYINIYMSSKSILYPPPITINCH
jgi:hypothetical protein